MKIGLTDLQSCMTDRQPYARRMTTSVTQQTPVFFFTTIYSTLCHHSVRVFPIKEHFTAGVRYDRFDPNTAKANTQWAVTPYVNIPLTNGFQLIAEYQHRDFQIDTSQNRQNDTFQVRVIFIQ